ncbi:hypothetical protein [Bacillus sp. FJAT-50079]|uniref:DUF6843 domain-containing protein n=1 Tax=Bacillus sp. FJAT-50079 TaxID=2833577 RepID=UPI001BCA4AFB|nr:hypothetical protein [Bacillus sp. FJAT-50079]MBS4209483.1 hypothetical protein [Bacillus sp. FJAT-50079]
MRWSFLKLLKIMFAAVILSFVISLFGSFISYTKLSEREPNVYYFSIWEGFIFAIIYITPILLVVSILAYTVYVLMGKITRFSRTIKVIFSILLAATVISLTLYLLNKSDETNDIYLIPNGYEGDVYVFYNVKGAPIVKTEDGYEVHVINEKGYFVTSTPDMDYGIVTDKYYYVDEKGNRTAINHTCVSPFGTGGFSTSADEEIDIRYTGFKLTKVHCNDEFRTESHGRGENKEKIIREIIKEYYGVEW